MKEKATPENGSIDHFYDAALAEYDAIRDEILQSMRSQQSVLGFGTAALALLVGAGIDVVQRQASAVIFLVLVPFVAQLILLVWGAEVVRMLRAGRFLLTIEHSLDDRLGEPVLRWERWIHGEPLDGLPVWPNIDTIQTRAITWMFYGISAGSLVLGAVNAFQHLRWFWATPLVVFGLAIFVIGARQVKTVFQRAVVVRKGITEHVHSHDPQRSHP